MQKPDDIPEDVLALAKHHAYATETDGNDAAAITSEIGVTVIARAILSERGRLEAVGVVDAEWKTRCEIAEADRADMAETIRRLEARTFGSQLVGLTPTPPIERE